MKFLQISTYYPAYLRDFYAAKPHLLLAGHGAQIDALLDDGFSDSHIFSRSLRAYGVETFQVAFNDPISQGAWLGENGFPLGDPVDCIGATLRQIEKFAPDVVYTTDVATLDSQFFRRLKVRPPLIAGWRGFPLVAGTDLSSYDLILTSFDRIFTEAKACGAKAVERFYPGFLEDCPVLSEKREIAWDVVFSGTVTHEHKTRVQVINMIAELSREPGAGFSFGVFMPNASAMSPLVQSLNKGARWAHDMLRLLRSARIVVNIDVDAFGFQPPNMRLIEGTGAGAFLMTPHHPDLPKFFAPGQEVETFRNANELVSKVLYFLANPAACDEIARRGQERCLRDHGHAKHTVWFGDIMSQALERARKI